MSRFTTTLISSNNFIATSLSFSNKFIGLSVPLRAVKIALPSAKFAGFVLFLNRNMSFIKMLNNIRPIIDLLDTADHSSLNKLPAIFFAEGTDV